MEKSTRREQLSQMDKNYKKNNTSRNHKTKLAQRSKRTAQAEETTQYRPKQYRRSSIKPIQNTNRLTVYPSHKTSSLRTTRVPSKGDPEMASSRSTSSSRPGILRVKSNRKNNSIGGEQDLEGSRFSGCSLESSDREESFNFYQKAIYIPQEAAREYMNNTSQEQDFFNDTEKAILQSQTFVAAPLANCDLDPFSSEDEIDESLEKFEIPRRQTSIRKYRRKSSKRHEDPRTKVRSEKSEERKKVKSKFRARLRSRLLNCKDFVEQWEVKFDIEEREEKDWSNELCEIARSKRRSLVSMPVEKLASPEL